jgi:hypothetical protein
MWLILKCILQFRHLRLRYTQGSDIGAENFNHIVGVKIDSFWMEVLVRILFTAEMESAASAVASGRPQIGKYVSDHWSKADDRFAHV